MSRRLRRIPLITSFLMLSIPGCGWILGLDEFVDAPPEGTSVCAPSGVEECYEGSPETEDIGLCRGGARTCDSDGQSWSACEGEVQPGQESCAAGDDENCDGYDCGIWASIFESSDALVRSVAVDLQGNIVVAGSLSTPIHFGDDPLGIEGNDFFIASFDRGGNHVWSRAFGETGWQVLGEVAVDGAGNIALVGRNEHDGGDPLLNLGGEDLGEGLFVAKLDRLGAHLWSRRVTGSFVDYENSGPVVALDSGGNVIVAGTFEASIDFGDGPLVPMDQLGTDVFVAKMSSQTGSTLAADGGWARTFGAPGIDKLNAVAVDGVGSVVVAGIVTGNDGIQFGSLSPLQTPTNYVVKMNGNGFPLWRDGFGGGLVTDLGVDAAGSWTLVGEYSGVISFGGDDLPNAADGAFVAQLDAQGAYRWSRGFVSSSNVSAKGVAIDGAGAVVVTGDFSTDADFGGGALLATSKVYVAKLDADGAYLWAKGFGEEGVKVGAAVAVDLDQQIVIAGRSQGVIDFGTGPLASQQTNDIFLAKLGL